MADGSGWNLRPIKGLHFCLRCPKGETQAILVTPRQEERLTGPAARIVLVEDNPGDVYLLEKALQARKLAYELVRYDDGEQALSGLAEEDVAPPDLILVDLNLPKRGGFEVLTAVRQMPRLVGVPLGVLTSSQAAHDRHRTALIGGARYIQKPPTLDEFIHEVGKAVEELLSSGKRQPG